MSEIRIPTQKRSIEKKEQILKAGYRLFSTLGYYKTDTAKIAKEAKVSTGIVYSYFKDKKQILIESSILTINSRLAPLFSFIEKFTLANYKEYIRPLMEQLINYHKESVLLHNEIQSLLTSDPQLLETYNHLIEETIHKISDILINNGFNPIHIHERIHLAITLIEQISHEVAFSMNPCIDKESMIYEGELLIEQLIIR